MDRKIKVNWAEVRHLGNRTAKNCENFENSRVNMKDIIASTATCWQGIDSENFRTNVSSYLEALKRQTENLDEWTRFFNRSSARYNDGVDDGLNRVKNASQDYNLQNLGR